MSKESAAAHSATRGHGVRRASSVGCRWAWLLLLLAGAATVGVGLVGCAKVARISGGLDDYEQYRRTVLAGSFEARLNEGWRYLRSFPEGHYQHEVRAWFTPAEEGYAKRAWDSQSRLYAYLETLPDGPHADAARRRLIELEQKARQASADDSSELRLERERQQDFDAAQQSRQQFQMQLVQWIAELSATRLGTPRSQLEPSLRQRYFEEEPPPTCDEQRCSKVLGYTFRIPGGKRLTERTANLTIVLHLGERRGRRPAATPGKTLQSAPLGGDVVDLDWAIVSEITLEAHFLFDRISESSTLRRVELGDLQARAEAIGIAVQFVGTTIESSFPEAHCSDTPVSPTVLQRRCEGRQLSMVSAESFETPDRIRWTEVKPRR